MATLSDADLQALVEVCVEQGMTFGETSKEVRVELNHCGIGEAVNATLHGLDLARKGGHGRCEAMYNDWKSRHMQYVTS